MLLLQSKRTRSNPAGLDDDCVVGRLVVVTCSHACLAHDDNDSDDIHIQAIREIKNADNTSLPPPPFFPLFLRSCLSAFGRLLGSRSVLRRRSSVSLSSLSPRLSSIFFLLASWLALVASYSPAWVYPTGNSRYGYHLSSQVRHGQDSRFCSLNSSSFGT